MPLCSPGLPCPPLPPRVARTLANILDSNYTEFLRQGGRGLDTALTCKWVPHPATTTNNSILAFLGPALLRRGGMWGTQSRVTRCPEVPASPLPSPSPRLPVSPSPRLSVLARAWLSPTMASLVATSDSSSDNRLDNPTPADTDPINAQIAAAIKAYPEIKDEIFITTKVRRL